MSQPPLQTTAVVLEQPERLALARLDLTAPGADDVVVDIEWSGISTGTERLLWAGTMPDFPGMGYPLVPGYESVGRVVDAGHQTERQVGERVFVPGARCFQSVRGLFGGAASRLVVPGSRVVPIPDALEERAVLLALAATAYHALTSGPASEVAPDLIIGHGVLGRLAARLTLALGYPAPAVWEADPSRRTDGRGYTAMAPDPESGNRYDTILDVSGAADLLDTLIEQLAPGGEIILAGFYSQPLQFTFPPAFLREARIRVAAEWRAADLAKVTELAASGSLDLDGLITHRHPANEAHDAYRTAFSDVHCLKMILDWSEVV